MSRDLTFTELNQVEAISGGRAEFVMDEETFRALYERNARGLLAYLARVTGDHEAADELLQETFYRFLRAASTHETETHQRNSLYRIATNLARDARRREMTRPFSDIPGDEIERVPARDSVEAGERLSDFTRAMAILKPRERAMLWLAYAEGASHREIAASLGLGERSMKTLLFRARRKLAVLLGRPREVACSVGNEVKR